MTLFLLLTAGLSCFLSLVVTRCVRDSAIKLDWLDRNLSSRNVHSRPIPRLGGIGIVGGFFGALAMALLVSPEARSLFTAEPLLWQGLLGGGLGIALVGLYDDFKGVRARNKLTLQLGIATLLCLLGFWTDVIRLPYLGTFELGVWGVPVSIFWMLAVVNAVNLIDGLDGLAGGVAVFALGTYLALALGRGDTLMALILVALLGAVVGFLVFNFNPASIFMGDTGSLFLGFVLAAVSLKTSAKSDALASLLVPTLALGLPLLDTTLAVLRRGLQGRPLFSADKEHIHHRLMGRLGLSHRKAVLVLWGVCGVFGLAAMALALSSERQQLVVLAAVAGAVLLLARRLGFLDLHRIPGVLARRRHNRRMHAVLGKTVSGLTGAVDRIEAEAALREMARALDASYLTLRHPDLPEQLVLHGGAPASASSGSAAPSSSAAPSASSSAASSASPAEGYEAGLASSSGEVREEGCSVAVIVPSRGGRAGSLHVGWTKRSEVDRDEERVVEKIAPVLGRRMGLITGALETRPGLRGRMAEARSTLLADASSKGSLRKTA